MCVCACVFGVMAAAHNRTDYKVEVLQWSPSEWKAGILNQALLKFAQKNKRLSAAWQLKFELLKSNAVSIWRVLNVSSFEILHSQGLFVEGRISCLSSS